MTPRGLHQRARSLTDEIAEIEVKLGFRAPKGELGWRTYHDAVVHQSRVEERAAVIGELRRGMSIVRGHDLVAEMLA